MNHVSQLLTGLSSNKATGVDKISCEIIKIAAPAISDSLTQIFNQAITLSSFPDEWKTARVTPLYKNGQRNVAGNYRPISVLPAVSKIMEKILYDQLYSYLSKFSLLSDNQFFENFILLLYILLLLLRIDFKRDKQDLDAINIDNVSLEVVDHAKILGLIISDSLQWNHHVNHITKKANKRYN